ncbi:ParB/RepB/Spo0J family partition protein [uncultured Tateyamaria sp.]|uniref:ParB/RepB/Spo0J family partition protein n=1 Tax=uncultured Tateyamaria sp. TaxID=455651 RepID=UPI00261A7F6F|nr:ParB/RepB/Spo0J family partition protein [uncultured Tateyamaria sp.]
MTLQHINIENLSVSPLNVRKYGAKDCADLVTSIRSLGVLQPLLVRETADGFEVIAGQRRFNACRIIAEDGDTDPLPCLVMAEGDDATAIEASLAENIERLPMDEVDQYKAFATLIKEGREPADIAATFGITERTVSQRLALGRLYAPILTAYRKGDIHARDIRILTMATTKQQKAWWALVKDEEAYVPTGQRLKDWLFGGAHIPVANAQFDVEASGLAVVSDLFGEDAYFADAEAFWIKQEEAIQMIATGYEVLGWAETVVMERGAYFATWDHQKTTMKDGGRVFITVSQQGEVTEHEGYITRAEAKRREKADTNVEPAPKPELTKAAQNYVDLHRHAAVRSDLLSQSGIALRLIAAHMIAGSSLWQVESDPQKTAKPEIEDSLARNVGHRRMVAQRADIKALLGMDDDTALMDTANAWSPRPCITEVFATLQSLSDDAVTRILTFLMADGLSVHSPLIDKLGEAMEADMRNHWSPEPLFFDLVRDKQVLNAMVREYAGETAADQNLTATAKTQRAILTACLDGTRAPEREDWMPYYMAFPSGSYRYEVKAVDKSGEEPNAAEDISDTEIDLSEVEQAKAA